MTNLIIWLHRKEILSSSLATVNVYSSIIFLNLSVSNKNWMWRTPTLKKEEPRGLSLKVLATCKTDKDWWTTCNRHCSTRVGISYCMMKRIWKGSTEVVTLCRAVTGHWFLHCLDEDLLASVSVYGAEEGGRGGIAGLSTVLNEILRVHLAFLKGEAKKRKKIENYSGQETCFQSGSTDDSIMKLYALWSANALNSFNSY